jgi:DNA-binding transcriptional LysR family regulator
LIHYAPTFGGSSDGFEYLDADGNPHEIAMSGRLTVNSSQAYVAGAVHGLGIIQIPEVGVREELRAGTLVEILPDFRPQGVRVSLLYPHGNHLPRRVNAFMTWMIGVLTPFLVTKRQK